MDPTRKLKPVSSGGMLGEKFLKPLAMSNYRLAKVTRARILAKIEPWASDGRGQGARTSTAPWMIEWA